MGTAFNISFSVIIHIIILIIAVYLAIQCNKPGERVFPVIAAALVPEIYILQRVVRRDILLEEGYDCAYSLSNKPSAIYTSKLFSKNKTNGTTTGIQATTTTQPITVQTYEVQTQPYEPPLYNPPSPSTSTAQYIQ